MSKPRCINTYAEISKPSKSGMQISKPKHATALPKAKHAACGLSLEQIVHAALNLKQLLYAA